MNKIVLVGIAILAVGLIALPQTFALFAGQHDWYDVNAADGQGGVSGIPCMKCHADVAAQMDAMGANQPHKSALLGANPCTACHVDSQIDAGLLNVSDVGGSTADRLHAAAAPECLDCHGDGILGYAYSGAPQAVSIFGNNYANNNASSLEVHGEFVSNASSGENLLKGANEACVGCHTHVGVNATWVKPTMLSFKAGVTELGQWSVSNFRADAGYTNTDGQPVGQVPYNENTGIAVINETGVFIPAP